MKKIKIISVIFSIIFCIYSCTKNNDVKTKDQIIQKKDIAISLMSQNKTFNYSGEEYFKGLFFGANEIANATSITGYNYDLYQNYTIEEKEKCEVILNFIVSYIKNKDQNFFTNFAINITSKNKSIIHSSLYGGSQFSQNFILKKSLLFFQNYNLIDMKSYLNNLSLNKDNAEISKSLGSETVISTIFDLALALVEIDGGGPTCSTVQATTNANLYILADELSTMNLTIKP
jgi:hypothetical protein